MGWVWVKRYFLVWKEVKNDEDYLYVNVNWKNGDLVKRVEKGERIRCLWKKRKNDG